MTGDLAMSLHMTAKTQFMGKKNGKLDSVKIFKILFCKRY